MSDTRTAAAKLVETFAELHEQQGLVLRELRTLIAGGDGIGARLKRLREAFSTAWESRYRTPYAFAFAKDNALLKRLAQAFDDAEIQRRIAAYLRSDEAFYVRTRHPFGVFCSQFNVFAAPAEASARPVGCDCVVACRSEAEHTTRRLESLAR